MNVDKTNKNSKIYYITITVLFILFQFRIWGMYSLSGDEPHYLMTSISILKDFDLNLFNNYQQKDFKSIGMDNLIPQVAAKNDFIPPEHGIGFPIIILIPYWLFGVSGSKVFLILISYLTVFFFVRLCYAFGYTESAGITAGFILCVSPTWQLHTQLIYPEIIMGFLSVLVLYLIQKKKITSLVAFIIGSLIAFFPFLYLKYSPIGVAMGLYCLSVENLRKNKFFYFGIVIMSALTIFLWVSTYGPNINIGTGAGIHDFNINGSFFRLWPQWLDAKHGLILLQPIYIMSFLAIPLFLIIICKPNGQYKRTFFISLACLGYIYMHAMFTGSPGASYPGRYLCAILPLLTVLIVSLLEVLKKKSFCFFLYFLLLPEVYFMMLIAIQKKPPLSVLPKFYSNLFLSFW